MFSLFTQTRDVNPCHLWDLPHLKPYHSFRLDEICLLMKQDVSVAREAQKHSAAQPWTLDLSCSPTASAFAFWLKDEVRVTSPSQSLPMTVQPASFSPWTGPQRSGVNAPVHGFVSGLMKCFLWVPDNAAHHSLTVSESLFCPCVRTCEEITPSTPDSLSGCDVRWETRMSLIIKMEGRSNLAAGSCAVQSRTERKPFIFHSSVLEFILREKTQFRLESE